jgi:rhodanese-related sulfurtransferase
MFGSDAPPQAGRQAPRLVIDQMLQDARAVIDRVTAEDAFVASRDHGGVLVDIRLAEHLVRHGHLAGALEISLNVLEWRLDPDSDSRHPAAPSLDEWIILVCEQGYSSSLAAARLQQLGFGRATDLIGGFEAWRTAGLPVVPDVHLEGVGATARPLIGA